jgi:hypothetical protein
LTGISSETTSERDAEDEFDVGALDCETGLPAAGLVISNVSFETGAMVIFDPRADPLSENLDEDEKFLSS